jgi:hypothetical protein
MLPACLVVVPRPVAVVTTPVRPEGESDDRQADGAPVAHHRNIGSLVGIGEASAIGPAPQVRHCHVAPLVAIDAAHDGDRHTTRQLCYGRIIISRTGVHHDRRIRVGLNLRKRDARRNQQRGGTCKHRTQKPLTHQPSIH